MIRKALGGLVLLGLGGYLLMGTSMGSYVRTAYVQTVGYCKGQIPVEFKIERARTLISELGPDIHNAARDIAVEEVRVSRLKTDIASAQRDMEEQQVAILALRDQLKAGLASYTVGQRTFSKAELERDLARRFRSFKRVSESIEQRREMLAARETKLTAARDTYAGLIETKKELESEIESLEAEQKTLQARKVAKRITIDEGRFEEARTALNEIREQLAVDQKILETEGYMVEPVPAEELPPVNLTDEIDSYFGTTSVKPSA
jgi:chromosome segregation ATPase